MNRVAQKLIKISEKKLKNSLAPDPSDALAFREYTQRIWTRLAKRPISPDEAEQIIEDFGQFLRVLASENGEDL